MQQRGGSAGLRGKRPASVFAAGLHVPEPTLVPSEPQFPPLYMGVASKGALLATLAWLRISCALQVLPEL